MICAFIAEHRARFGVAPICRVLSAHGCPIAPRTFYAWVSRAPSKRALWDMVITEMLAGYYEPDEHGRKTGVAVRVGEDVGPPEPAGHHGGPVHRRAADAGQRLAGCGGSRRSAPRCRTRLPRAPDLVQRRFRAPAPSRLLVADFTYVRMADGLFAYTAFVIDAYANRIVGWECSTSKQTAFVESAIRQAAALRAREGHPTRKVIHHSDAGSQGGFKWSSQHLMRRGVHVVSEEGVLGWSSAAGCGPGDSARVAVPGPAAAVSGCGAGVLAVDRPGRLQ